MATFTDADGREWTLRITLGRVPKLREAGFDVDKLDDERAGFAALASPEPLGKVLWALCERQAEARTLTPEGFADGFDGPALFRAQDALMEAVADFTQRPTVAAAYKRRLAAANQATEGRAIAALAGTGSSGSAGSSPASPASTAPTAPSAS
jgi:hypothetical protein